MYSFHNPASSHPGISTRSDQFSSCVDGSSQLRFQEHPGTSPLQSSFESPDHFRSPIHGDMQFVQEVSRNPFLRGGPYHAPEPSVYSQLADPSMEWWHVPYVPLSPSTTSTCSPVPLVMNRSPAIQNAFYRDQYPSPLPLYHANLTSVLRTIPPSQLSSPIPNDDQSRGLFNEYGCKVEQRICTGDGTLTPVFPMGYSVDGVSRPGPTFQRRPRKKVASPEVIKASSIRRKISGPAKFKCPRDGCGQDFTRNANLDNHLRSHDDIQKFRCSKCGRKLRSSLKRHEDKCRGSDVIED